MRTRPDCLVCFLRQTLATARIATSDPGIHYPSLLAVGAMLDRFDMAISPPENAVLLYEKIAEITGKDDPYRELKDRSTRLALSLRDTVRAAIQASADPLRLAIRYSIRSNIIDYAAQHRFDPDTVMEGCEQQEFFHDDYPLLRQRIRPGAKVLVLADNCGEIVFDGLVAEQLLAAGCQVTLAVRASPIINDATLEDARDCGITEICRVIDNGCGCPGTPLHDCSDEFRHIFAGADLIISKGMGNFETLSETDAPLFFLFTVKCERVARHLNRRFGLENQQHQLTGNGEMILLWQQHEKRP